MKTEDLNQKMHREQALRAVETLNRARALISKPESWCQYSMALDGRGEALDERCEVTSKWASRFCLLGAVKRARFEIHYTTECGGNDLAYVERAIEDAQGEEKPPLPLSISGWNDTSTRKHQDVLDVLEMAIMEAELEGRGIYE